MKTRQNKWNWSEEVLEWIELAPGELPIDAVGLWQIVPAGRDKFKMKAEELDDFIKAAVMSLMAAGAVPVRHREGSAYTWTQQAYLGVDPEKVAERVVKEWHELPDDPMILVGSGVWFARPLSEKWLELIDAPGAA
jgi:hypothetical protein